MPEDGLIMTDARHGNGMKNKVSVYATLQARLLCIIVHYRPCIISATVDRVLF